MGLSQCAAATSKEGRELACHGQAEFPVACYHDDLSRNPVPWHWHPELEALVVVEGTAEVAAGAERFTVGPGEGAFISAGVLHAAWARGEPDCRIHSAVFHPRLVGGGADSVFWSKYLLPLLGEGGREHVRLDGSEGWHAQAVQALEGAWESCVREPPGYEFQTREALSRLVFLLSRHQGAGPRPERALREEQRVKRMLEHIHRHYASELTAASIAKAASISESECLRCFRRVIGLPPTQYIARYRMQQAAELLAASDLPVSEVGARCGFQDASYFAKTFRALKGCTPTAFRARAAEQNGGKGI